MKVTVRKFFVLGVMLLLLSLASSSIAFGQGPVDTEPTKEATTEPTKAAATTEPTEAVTNAPTVEPTKVIEVEPAKETTVEPTTAATEPSNKVEIEPTKEATVEPTATATEKVEVAPVEVKPAGTIVNPPSQTSNVLLQNTSASPASVTVKVYKTDGSEAFSNTFSLSGSGARTIHAGAGTSNDGHLYMNLPGAASLTQEYAMVVSSDQRLVATNVTAGGTAPALAHSIYSGLDSASTASDILLPSIHWRDSQWSLVAIQNAGSSAAAVDISYFRQDGSLIKKLSVNIPVGSSHFRNAHEDVSIATETKGVGSIRVTSTNGQALAVAVEETLGSYTSAYEGIAVTAADTKLSFPSVHRNSAGQYSHILVQNTEAANDATVTLTYYDQAGNQVDQFTNITIPKAGALTFHTTNGTSDDGKVYEPTHLNIVGSATVEATNGVKLVALVVETVSGMPYAYDGFNSGASANTVLLPSIHRNLGGQFSHSLVQNTSSSASNKVTIKYIKQTGEVANTFDTTLDKGGSITFHTTQTLSGGAANTYDPKDLGNVGSAQVTCEQACNVVVVETLFGAPGAYNGFK